jgi:NAD(P)-dependent dehydrogenase (short-subunit alcohol dehydrogenase family)
VKAHKHLSIVPLDVTDSKAVAALPAALAAIGVTSVDVLVNNAGVGTGAKGVEFLTKLSTETVDNFIGIYRTNVIAIWEVTEKLLPLLRKSSAAFVYNVSSIMGSVAITNEMWWPGLAAGYRLSKAALNELSAVQAREYNVESVTAAASADAKTAASAAPLISIVALHPVWVDTDMGSQAGKPPTTIAQSAAGIVNVIATGKTNAKTVFLDFENKPQAW